MLAACAHQPPAAATSQEAAPSDPPARIVDPHSYANTEAFVTQRIALDLTVDFEHQVLRGSVELTLNRVDGGADTLVLDTRDLDISAVETAEREGAYRSTSYSIAQRDPILGSALRITMPQQATRVRIHYATRPEASGLQWLSPAQTAGKRQPFLFTQSQAIHARSWIPLQDTPRVRAPYDARIKTPAGLMAVMSAENPEALSADGEYHFSMPQPIPSYLIALAVGDLRFQAMGKRTGVYTEPSMLAAAASEFEDTEAMLERCEAIFGPYRWGRYDLLILPPSFPYGGMENPRLTFVTPSVITGDKSLVSLIAHELAHSWSGNLVTNATWNDFWLNEGFTVHLTNRIVEEVFGLDVAQQERAIGASDLKRTLSELEDPRDKTLVPELAGRDPDDNVTDVPYEKGALFLAYLEQQYGRARFDEFLRGWFDAHAFQSETTADFRAWLDRELLQKTPGVVSAAKIEEWMTGTEMPTDTPWPQSTAFAAVDTAREAWLSGSTPLAEMDTAHWSTRQWEYFLNSLPTPLPAAQLAALDDRFGLSKTTNRVIAARWFRDAALSQYQPAYPALRKHLNSIGRMLLIEPVYTALAKTPDGLALAEQIYAEARSGYHPIAQTSVEKILARARAEQAEH
jgi:leukotriene-A4 hydrolase